MGFDDYVHNLKSKRNQLLDIYKQNPEAKSFIEKHLHEFPEKSYEDLTHVLPSVIKMNDVSCLIKYTHLLPLKNQAIMQDYWNGLSPAECIKKHKIESIEKFDTLINSNKKKIRKRIQKELKKQTLLERRKIGAKQLKEPITSFTLNLTRKNIKLHLVKVRPENRIRYKYHDDDIDTIYNKCKHLQEYLSIFDAKKVDSVLSKYQRDTLKLYPFDTLCAILGTYRLVNEEGYFLPKIIEDAVWEIMANDPSVGEQINELFQMFN